MANRPWFDIKTSGWPKHANITVSIREGDASGNPVNGTIKLLMRKGNDRNSDVPIQINNNDFIGDVKDGMWEVTDWDLTWFDEKGFDTLIVDYNGFKWPRTFRKGTGRANPGPLEDKKDQQVKIFLRVDDPEPVRDGDGKLTGYTINAYATATKGKEQYSDKKVEFLANGEVVPDCPRELKGGKVNYIFDIKPIERVHLSARIESTSIEDTKWDVKVPMEKEAKKKDPKVATLTASCSRGTKIADDTMRYNVTLWAQDEHGNPVGGKTPTWKTEDNVEAPVPGATAPDTGLLCHTVDVIGAGKTMEYQTFIRKEGAASNALTLKGPEKPKEHNYAIEADLESPHPVGDKFIIAGTTTVDGKLGSVACTISTSPENAIVEGRLGKVEPGPDPNTYKLTTSGGKFRITIPASSFSCNYLEVEIVMPNATISAIVPVVKPK